MTTRSGSPGAAETRDAAVVDDAGDAAAEDGDAAADDGGDATATETDGEPSVDAADATGPVTGSSDPGSLDVVVTMQHPAHVHFFRHAIRRLEADGHRVHVFARDKAVTRDLLEAYDVEYELLAGAASSSLPGLARTQFTYEARLLRRALAIDPDVMTAIGGIAVSHVAPLVGARSVVFTDTEHADLINRLAFPFADRVVTPECFHDGVGDKQVTYPGYHELAYLHPDRFDPDPAVPRELGIEPDDRYVVLRLISWEASHDREAGGFEDVTDVVDRLEATGATVLVTAEGDLPPAVADRQVSVEPHRMHDLLAFADLFVGEGATMAAESAVLGTPAVYVNTLRMGYTDELDARYGLLFNCGGPRRHQRALRLAERLLADDDTDWTARRDRMLAEKCDTTETVLSVLLQEDGDDP